MRSKKIGLGLGAVLTTIMGCAQIEIGPQTRLRRVEDTGTTLPPSANNTSPPVDEPDTGTLVSDDVPYVEPAEDGGSMELPVDAGDPIEPEDVPTPVEPDAGPMLPPGELTASRFDLTLSPGRIIGGTYQDLLGLVFRSTGAPVALKMFRIGFTIGGAMNGDPIPNWTLSDLALRGTANIPGLRMSIRSERILPSMGFEGGYTNTVVTFVYDRELIVTRDGVTATFGGRSTGDLRLGDRLYTSFVFGEGRYTYAGSSEGALLPGNYLFPSYSEVTADGPHLFYGTGRCDTIVPAAYHMPGNATRGIILWSPRLPGHNELDCSNGGSADWHNVLAAQYDGHGGGPINSYSAEYTAVP